METDDSGEKKNRCKKFARKMFGASSLDQSGREEAVRDVLKMEVVVRIKKNSV